jgi:hypothetical protein
MLGDWLGRLLGAKQWRRYQLGNWAIEALDGLGSSLGHLETALAQVKVRQAPI